jgi:hypothetical protein
VPLLESVRDYGSVHGPLDTKRTADHDAIDAPRLRCELEHARPSDMQATQSLRARAGAQANQYHTDDTLSLRIMAYGQYVVGHILAC